MVKYYSVTLCDETGMVKLDDFENVPEALTDTSAIQLRLYDPRPLAPEEWSAHAVAYFDDALDEEMDWRECDVFTLGLYPVISLRFRRVLEGLLTPEEIEFLPVRLIGKQTGLDLGVYYLPHALARYDCVRSFWQYILPNCVPAEARIFIGWDSEEDMHFLLWREDIVEVVLSCGLVGIAFTEHSYYPDGSQPSSSLPMGLVFFALPEEQLEWLRWMVSGGSFGFVYSQYVDKASGRLDSRVAPVRTMEELDRVRWEFSESEYERLIQYKIYLSRWEWADRVDFPSVPMVLQGGGLSEFLRSSGCDAFGQGWYGLLEVGYRVGRSLRSAGWFLPYGWRDEPLEEFEPLYRWWESGWDWWDERFVSEVRVRHKRSSWSYLDNYMSVTVGACRWYKGGGVLLSMDDPVRLEGKGLRGCGGGRG